MQAWETAEAAEAAERADTIAEVERAEAEAEAEGLAIGAEEAEMIEEGWDNHSDRELLYNFRGIANALMRRGFPVSILIGASGTFLHETDELLDLNTR